MQKRSQLVCSVFVQQPLGMSRPHMSWMPIKSVGSSFVGRLSGNDRGCLWRTIRTYFRCVGWDGSVRCFTAALQPIESLGAWDQLVPARRYAVRKSKGDSPSARARASFSSIENASIQTGHQICARYRPMSSLLKDLAGCSLL